MSASAVAASASATDSLDALVGSVEFAVRGVLDPELGGLSIGDLGLVHSIDVDERDGVCVVLLPTFLGCPALALMATDVAATVGRAVDMRCSVTWANEPAWSSARISPAGVAHLATLGIAVATTHNPRPPCPTCSSSMLLTVNPVGATACRSVAWCPQCRSVIDVLGADRVG